MDNTPISQNAAARATKNSLGRPYDEPVFMKDPIEEQHAHDSSSLSGSRAGQWARLLGSPATWVLLAATALALVLLVLMAFHLHPVDSGHVRGPGDEAAPNAPSDYKHR